MAQVFLSYEREDARKAQVIAQALERAGHSVWWDRHIKGGAKYNEEIEEALKRAEAVVVIWSERSVRSAWVRDEAAVGRDTGRLIPVTIDGTEPPLGFRQYQMIDLSRWKGRGKSQQVAELMSAVEAVSGPAPASIPAQPAERKSTGLIPWSLALLGAALVAVGLWLWTPWDRGSTAAIVAVAPTDQTSPSASLANNLLAQLGHLQSMDTSLQLVGDAFSRNPDFLFKVGSQTDGANLALFEAQGALLWSREFHNSIGNLADLRQQMAYTAAQVLQCAGEAHAAQGGPLETGLLKIYLGGCADLSFARIEPGRLVSDLRKVTAQAPRFENGWAMLLRAELQAFKQSDLADPDLRRNLKLHVEQARRVSPKMAETFLAEAWTTQARPINGWMRHVERAVEFNPWHSVALQERITGYFHVGRLRDAVSDARRAVEVDPLSPEAHDSLISALAYSGQFQAALGELEKAERLWPGASNLRDARYRLMLRYGDAKEALKLLRSGNLNLSTDPGQESFAIARSDSTPANIDRAIGEARTQFERNPASLFHFAQVLAEFGHKDELARILLTVEPKLVPGVIIVLFRPQFEELRDDPRFMVIADRLDLTDYWRASGQWPDFCFEPDLPYDCEAEAAKIAA